MSYYLQIRTPSGEARIRLTDKTLTIGRSSDNKLKIHEPRASRNHCVIEHTPGGYVLRDLESRNGTKINHRRVTSVTLEPGTEFSIGKTIFQLLSVKEDAGEEPPVDPSEEGDVLAGPPSSSDTDTLPMISEAGFTPPGYGAPAVPDLGAPTPAAAAPAKPAQAKAPQGQSASNRDPLQPAPKLRPPSKNEPDPLAPAAHMGLTVEPAPQADAPPSSAPDLAKLNELGRGSKISEGDLELIDSRGGTVHASQGKSDHAAGEGIKLLRLLLMGAIRTRASDIHVEPKSSHYLVRMRIDGIMVETVKLDPARAQLALGVVKVLCSIELGKRNIIQEGHFSVKKPGGRIDYRVSFTPSMLGQKLVVRVLDLSHAPQSLPDLQMPQWMLDVVSNVCKQDAGMVLVCGPTGSGKTTSLYAALRTIDVKQRNVITIEDPVEYQLEGVTQIPIDQDQGNTFHSVLRSALRQDPDVIMLGEIRDIDTARTAMQAAVTGHLVFSTVHARDTFGTIFRLLDLGAEPYLVASSLNLVFAQRLVRELCPHCKDARRPTPQQMMHLNQHVRNVKEIYAPVGCPRCLGTGYMGRRGLFEMLTLNDDLRDVILQTPTMSAIRGAVNKTMFATLRHSGCQLIAEGITGFDEIDRVASTE